jgi:hypothetical protein
MDMTVITNGAAVSANPCLVTFVIRPQNGDDFTGSFTAAPINGVTVAPCAQETSFSGKFSKTPPSSAVTEVEIVALPAEIPPGCTLISQTPLRGVVFQNGIDLALQGLNRFQCGTLSPFQSISFTLQKR